ncbi:MAG: serine hydrolase domain-containing protein [Pseudomonadota bacterium]
MTRLTSTTALLLTLAIAGCGGDPRAVNSYLGLSIPTEVLDAHLTSEMERLDIPGMSIAFINQGQVIHHRTFGFANVQHEVAVDDETIFEAASLSKPLFAYFVMTYVEAGKLDLDTPLYTYLPYPDIAYDERYKQITARMVLSHRTGFPNWRGDLPEKKLLIQFDPGTDYFYSGEGYQYLAMVLKEIDQTDWEGLEARFQELVAQPLGLQHTVFIQDDYSKTHKAEPYDENGEWISPERDYDRSVRFRFVAPASVHSEAQDFSRWLIALMDDKGLRPSSFRELYAVHSFVDEYNGIKVDYTLGFFKPRLPFTNIYLHGGNNYGFTSYFAVDPKKDWGFVLFTNSEYGEQLGNELTFYLLTGPDLTPIYLIGAGILVTLLLIGVLLGRAWIRRRRARA